MWAWWTLDPNGFQLRGCCKLLTGFLCLLVTVFFVHWQSGFLCSSSASPFCPLVLGWYQPRLGTATQARRPNPPLPSCCSGTTCAFFSCEIDAFLGWRQKIGVCGA